MRDNTIYAADNGRLVCSKCAGYTAKATGCDISGQPLVVMTAADRQSWSDAGMGRMACESGCTVA